MYGDFSEEAAQWVMDTARSSHHVLRGRLHLLLRLTTVSNRREVLEILRSDLNESVRRLSSEVPDEPPEHSLLFGLLESEFAEFVDRGDGREWAWEWTFILGVGRFVGAMVRVWTADEDEATARRLALMKARVSDPDTRNTWLTGASVTPILCESRFVHRGWCDSRAPR